MATELRYPPAQFRQGTTVTWYLSTDYDPADYDLTYYFTAPGETPLEVVATDNGDGRFKVSIPASGAGVDTTDFAATTWGYVGMVTDGTETFQVDPPSGTGTVLVLPALTAAVDTRSNVKKNLDAIEDMLSGKMSAGDAAAYTIAGRSLNRYTFAELLHLRALLKREYQDELRQERISRGEGSKHTIYYRFWGRGI